MDAQMDAQLPPGAPAPTPWAESRELDVRTRAFGLDQQAFGRAFPFRLHVGADLRVQSAGAALTKAYPAVQPGVALADVFAVRRPRPVLGIDDWRRHAGEACTLVAPSPTTLTLRGNIELFDDGTLLLLVSPVLPSLEEMTRLGLTFSDFAKHDASVDLLLLAQTARASVHDAVSLAHRLQSRTELLSTILELGTSGVIYFDAAGVVKHASTALLEMLALERIATFDLTIPALDQWIGGLIAPDTRCCCPLARLMKQCAGDRAGLESGFDPALHSESNDAGRHVVDRDAASCIPRVEAVSQPLHHVLGLGDPTDNEPTVTLRLARPHPAIINIRAARTDSGGWVFYLRDVTRETEVDRLKSEFIATAAHELRTPMVSIVGFTELLLNRPVPEAQRRDMLETVLRQSKLLINMVNEMLDLARIEARQGKDMKCVPSRLDALIAPALTLFDSPGGDDRRRLQLQLAGHAHTRVQVDIDKAQRAITNVLANAFKYAQDTSPITLDTLGGTLRGSPAVGLRVSDAGIGMTPEQTARVFERFYRADPSGNTPGTGLGMSLVKEIMELHGGRVDIESELGRGTAVTLWWPVLHSADPT